MVKIEIDGNEIEARDGAMVIEAADEAGIYIPRFCYHKKLSVAANCRMCLVEVEKARKPLPACATPVTDGLKVMTKSPLAIAAQKGVMEFLLINHPLDCPICDQGGECELQDVAVGYGSDVSRYSEKKRVVPNKNIGSLISTDMTRCIHCTRCVRFGDEVAGMKELGATGRGEHMQIGTYVESVVDSELSGNMIDLCPVGALTSKPFRYSARSWEMYSKNTIAAHDSVGSNIQVHVRGRDVMRVVPEDNEQVNETWISDRDRFSYQGIAGHDRLTAPLMKINDQWQEVDWETALSKAAEAIRDAGKKDSDSVGFVASPASTLEELYLFQKLARALGINNIDHRLRQADFDLTDNQNQENMLGLNISEIEKLNSVLLVGANIRKEQPILAHRLRKAALAGASVSSLSSIEYELRFSLSHSVVSSPDILVTDLAAIAKALLNSSQSKDEPKTLPGLKALVGGVTITDVHEGIAHELASAHNSSLILGAQAYSHPQYSVIKMLALAITELSDSVLSFLPPAANSVGAEIVGVLPGRLPGHKINTVNGKNTVEMFKNKLSSYVLLNIEPELDFIFNVDADEALRSADLVVSLTPYVTENMKAYADILLPIGTFVETAGSFVNVEGRWQSFEGVISPFSQARPAWKILRVFGSMLNLAGFDYLDIDELHNEIRSTIGNVANNNKLTWQCPTGIKTDSLKTNSNLLYRLADIPMYSTDNIVRRATALQLTQELVQAGIYVNSLTAKRLSLEAGRVYTVIQDELSISLPVGINERIADACIYIPGATGECSGLNTNVTTVQIQKAK